MDSADPQCVREATASDAEAIARVNVDSWRETYSGVLADHHFSEEAFFGRWRQWKQRLSVTPLTGRTIVALHEGEVVGFAASGPAQEPDADHGFPPVRPLQLYSIYLLAAHQGTGLGQSMLDAALGNEPAQLWVLRGNARAITFYERNGFVADGVEAVDEYGPGLIDVRMVR